MSSSSKKDESVDLLKIYHGTAIAEAMPICANSLAHG